MSEMGKQCGCVCVDSRHPDGDAPLTDYLIRAVEKEIEDEQLAMKTIHNENNKIYRDIGDFFETCRDIVSERSQSYGRPDDCFERIASMWSVVLGDALADGAAVSGRDVARCMIALKLVRDQHSGERDNMIDIAGYAALGAVLDDAI